MAGLFAALRARIAPDPHGRVRVPTVIQMEAVECGAACLGMVLGYFGRFVPLEELRLLCGVTRDGSKASNLLRAAKRFGLEARGYRKEPAALRELPLPQIVFWNFNHFVVVEGFGDGKVYLNDPATGPQAVPDDEFDESFTGVVLCFEKTPGFEPGGERPGLIAPLRRRFSGLGGALAFLVVVGLALVLPGLVVPVFTSIFVDSVLVGGMHGWLWPLLTGMLLAAVLNMALTWLESYYLLRVETRLALVSTSRFVWHVLRLPVEFYTQRAPGEIGSRVELNDRVAELLTGDLARAALGALKTVFFTTVMFSYDVSLTVLALALAAVNVIALRLIQRRTEELSQRLSIESGKTIGVAMNGLSLMETVKASGGESQLFTRWAGYQARYLVSEQALASISLWLGSVPGLLSALGNLLVLGLGGLRVMDGQLTLGQLVAFQSLLASFMAPVAELVGLVAGLQESRGDMNRLDDVMRFPEDPAFGAVAGDPQGKLEGEVRLSGVTFGYSPTDPPLVRDFELLLRPGRRIAIVGPSGCGKSTISKLVMGLHQPWSGEILFDGKPRSALDRHALASSVAMVDQDCTLLEGSFRDNLTQWDPDVSEADMVQAARDACIHDIIQSRPGGYDAPIEEGGRNLSGGQRQRLEIARALCVNPRVLVLDEATSALDAATEQVIDSNLRRRGCACLIIAHRLSTIRDADEIVVLRAGRVVERGRHAELLAIPDGTYRQLVAEL